MSSILSGMFVISGTIDPVEGTAFDLNNSTEVASRIPDVPGDKGFDHNFAIGKPGWDKHMARWVKTGLSYLNLVRHHIYRGWMRKSS